MSEYTEIPLHLCQVLEEEFQSLHETLDWNERGEELTVRDDGETSDDHIQTGVVVIVKTDWGFHLNHARRALLAARLSDAYKCWKDLHPGVCEPEDRVRADGVKRRGEAPETWVEPDLAAYLAHRHKGLLEANTDEELAAALSKVLDDDEVFKRERFVRLANMRDETRGLFELFWEGDGEPCPKRGRDSDRTRFRRLLLEDAFPDEIRRAYDLRLARVVRRIHDLATERGGGRAAVCLSGGGIRSGTFALGVLQSLARRGFLDRFDYLSTVSGGGYIGGWLSAWIHRHPEGLRGVIADLNGETRASRLEPEPEPLRHLRDYSNFITPKPGLLSADAWTFITIYVRNLILNWVVLVPLLASLLMIPRVANAAILAPGDWWTFLGLLALSGIGAALLRLRPLRLLKAALDKRSRRYVLLFVLLLLVLAGAALVAGYVWPEWRVRVEAAAAEPRWTLLALGTLLSGYAVAFMRLNRPSNSGTIRPGSFWDKRRDQYTFLRLCLLPLCMSAALLTTYWAWHTTTTRPDWEPVYFLVFGVAVGLAGLVFYWLFVRQTWKDDPAERELGELRVLRRRQAREADGRAPAASAEEKGLAKEVSARKTAVRRSLWREGKAMLISSVIGAILLWAAATRIPPFYAPIADHVGPVIHFDGVAGIDVRMEVLPYQAWWHAELYTALAFPVYLLIIFLGITLFVGFTGRRSERPPRARDAAREAKGGGAGGGGEPENPVLSHSRYFIEDEDREWLARASAWLLIVMAAWLFFCGLVIFGPLLYFSFQKWLLAAGGASGLITILGGGSAQTPGKGKKDGGKDWVGMLKTIGVNVVVLASFVFFACLVLAVALLTGTFVAWLGQYITGLPDVPGAPLYGPHGAEFAGMYPFSSAQNAFRVTHFPTWLYLSLLALALHVFGRIASRVINLNKFSLHAGYRDRIIRAFLGASRPRGERQANPFTGFDPRDNLYMDELRPWVLRESDFKGANGLVMFVKALAGAETPGAPDAAPKTQASAAVAQYLRTEIGRVDGESLSYFDKKDPPESIATNPSFRTALFGDLSRILQLSHMKRAPEFEPYLEGARAKYERLAPPGVEADADGDGPPDVLLNRLLLLQAFPEYLKYPPRLYRLMHVVNMALNLVGGDKLAWQQRRAESFTSTPLHSGSLFVGYRSTRDYGGKNGISLGTAVAISGAAASSNMGYFSPSPFVTLALTFFNARLGWWLGNPGVHGAHTFYRSHPQSALSPILDEAFGQTDDKNPYVLLSDGGHFENLGLYEMVLRRCRNIIVVDGSADPSGTLEGLGDAVRKIRIDLGIPIEFKPPFPILSRPASEEKGAAGGYCAIGEIHYEDVDAAPDERGDAPRCVHERHKLTGQLIYLKPAIYGTEPRDIYNYAMSHPDFPHESTADQFFDEPQFESHRMLGFYILEQLFEEATHGPDGEDYCRERNLQKFVGWLDKRAEREREKASSKNKDDGKKDAAPLGGVKDGPKDEAGGGSE